MVPWLNIEFIIEYSKVVCQHVNLMTSSVNERNNSPTDGPPSTLR